MVIIKYGKVQPTNVVCRSCDAELLYTNQDIITEDSDWLGFASEVPVRYYVKCPVCGKYVPVEN